MPKGDPEVESPEIGSTVDYYLAADADERGPFPLVVSDAYKDNDIDGTATIDGNPVTVERAPYRDGPVEEWRVSFWQYPAT